MEVPVNSSEKETHDGQDLSVRASQLSGNVGTSELIGNVVDPALAAKTRLLNEAIDEIGWTTFHLKLSCLSGFGYAAYLEVGNGGFRTGSTMGLYAGLLVGALFWGFFADGIGRRTAFNTTLFLASAACMIAGAAPNWIFYSAFVAILGFGAGGNLVLDPTVMLEFVPSSQQWVITAMAGWWGMGQAAAGAIAWGFYSRSEWSCDGTDCTWQNNKAWRLIMFTGGALVLVMSLLRVFVVDLPETPKYLVATGQDEKLVSTLQKIATKYNRPCSLTLEALQACGQVQQVEKASHLSRGQRTVSSLVHQVRGLFATKKLALSTVMIWVSWMGIGLGYPLFFIYLPALLADRVPGYTPTFTETWRDYTVTNICAIFGPLIAAGMVEVKWLGRRYTMSIGATLTAILFFGYTAIKTPQQNLALSCSISVAINLYYGTLYAYTVETFPSAHRGTGNGIAVALNRVMGLLSAVISVTAGTKSATPLYISAGLFLLLAAISAVLPFEPRGNGAA
ncbi:hypothetical protein NLU13_6231 [Sarocladium strictum]|uniref:Major facilitator superfamily (MFS) profile domain-containing protein n=1 Tax=Sarocladium strictum TaxID=5046 RepID=A0AA39GH31_SARSR|nr:hypothetical protein NLU13_6231 [Sarocladium strictum]